MWINELSTIHLTLIVFVTQILFIFGRTLNVIYTAEKNMTGAMVTGGFVHLTWLITISVGVKSVMYLDWVVILGSLSGGLLGTYLGIKLKKYLMKVHFKNKTS